MSTDFLHRVEIVFPGETHRLFSVLWAGESLMGSTPYLRRGRRDETGLLSSDLGSRSHQLRGPGLSIFRGPEILVVAPHSRHGYVRFPASPPALLRRPLIDQFARDWILDGQTRLGQGAQWKENLRGPGEALP